MCIYLHTEAVFVCFVDDLYLRNIMLGYIMLGYAHEQKAHGGAVDRCGQQNAVFVTLVGPIKRFEAQWSKFFEGFNRFVVIMSRSDS